MTLLNSDGPSEDELMHSQRQIARLEVVICELLSKNEHLRMALSSVGPDTLRRAAPVLREFFGDTDGGLE